MSIPTEITVAAIGAAASIFAAFLAREQEKKRPKTGAKSSSTPSPRPTLVFTAIVAAGLALTAMVIAIFWPRPGPALPVGTVVPLWGTATAIPNGYEICDGELVTTPGSSIHKTRKPDLRDQFIKGAKADIPDVTTNPETGGQNDGHLDHTHHAGTLFALITQQTVGTNKWNIPHTARGEFIPKNDGNNMNGQTHIAEKAGQSSGMDDWKPKGTAIDGETEKKELAFDNRPRFVSLFYIIKVL